MGVYAAMSVTGGVVGLIAGGLLTTYASWRWVLFVNVPIGIAVALAAPRVLGETRGHRIILFVGTALFGMFLFLTVFLQAVWGYSALRTGVAYLPMMAALMAMSAASAQLVPRIGARPLLIAGSATAAGGCSGCPGSASTVTTPPGCSAPRLWPGPVWACCS